MRYPMAGKETLATLLTGGGAFAGGFGLARFLARRAAGPLALPLTVGGGLMWLGRTLGDSFVDLADDHLRVKLGALFDETIALADVARVTTAEWRLLGGLGVRTNMKDMVAVVTRAGPVAEISLWRPIRLPVIPKILHIRALRLVVSPENLDTFVGDLRSRLAR